MAQTKAHDGRTHRSSAHQRCRVSRRPPYRSGPVQSEQRRQRFVTLPHIYSSLARLHAMVKVDTQSSYTPKEHAFEAVV
jgi:hypothetical protein